MLPALVIAVALASAPGALAGDAPPSQRARWTRSTTGRWSATIKLRHDPGLAVLGNPTCAGGAPAGQIAFPSSIAPAETVALPCGNWLATRSGYRYAEPVPGSGVRRLRYQPERLTIRIAGISTATPLGPVAFAEVRFVAGGQSVCRRFETFSRNDAKTVRTTGPALPCTIACGDAVDDGEECDDGNTTDGDGCRHDCTIERCGDGIVDADELCDDGNATGGDVCASDCRLPDGHDVDGDGIVRIAAVGDSNTGGLSWLARSWCWQLVLPTGWEVVNHGELGMTAAAASPLVDEALADGPDFVVLALGTNDLRNLTAEETADAILALRARVRGACALANDPGTCVTPVVMTIPPIYEGSYSAEEAAALTEKAAAANLLVQAAVGSAVVDSFTGLGPEYFLDGVHLTTEGQAIRAERLWALIGNPPL